MADPQLLANLTTAQNEIDNIKSYMDSFFLIVMGCIVFLMQCGFAFLEAGAVRSKVSTYYFAISLYTYKFCVL